MKIREWNAFVKSSAFNFFLCNMFTCNGKCQGIHRYVRNLLTRQDHYATDGFNEKIDFSSFKKEKVTVSTALINKAQT